MDPRRGGRGRVQFFWLRGLSGHSRAAGSARGARHQWLLRGLHPRLRARAPHRMRADALRGRQCGARGGRVQGIRDLERHAGDFQC